MLRILTKKPMLHNLFIKTLSISLVCFLFIQCKNHKEQILLSSQNQIDKKVDSLLSIMTLEEKVGQMNQYSGFWDATGPSPKEGEASKKYEDLKKGWVGSMLNVRGVEEVRALQKIAVEETRLGIPLIFGYDVIHGFKTISPIPLAESASWDLEAIKKSAQIAAAEAAVSGLNWTFAPMVDISRDARWGRVMEGAGEDPYLGSLIAKARIEGFQGDDLANEFTIVACAKHFAGYGFAEAGRDYNTVDVSENTLHNMILPPFKAAVEAKVRTFMTAFNEIGGIPAVGHSYLQRELLKKDWKFSGFVVTDWGTIGELEAHGFAENLKNATEIAANAGTDMDMESYGYVAHLVDLVKTGKVKESLVEEAAKRILRVKFELGLFENPYKYCDEAREKSTIGKPEFMAGVLDMAKKSIVLLKNEGSLLPLAKKGQNIAIIGDLAKDKTSPLGNWRLAADDETAVSVWEGVQKYAENNYTYARGVKLINNKLSFSGELETNINDRSEFKTAINLAKNADVVLMVLGEHGFHSGEARSRTDLELPGLQQELLEAIYQVNKNIVLVLQNGRPLTIEWAAQNIPAIVEGWQLGTQSGNALAEVLFGDYNPSGKLTMTFPRNVGQIPIYYNYKNTGRPAPKDPGSVFWSHYIDSENTPLYPFGYGLSYTTFVYSDFKISQEEMTENDEITVEVTISNTGNYDGKEVVQLYIRDLVTSTTRPVKELKDFALIELAKGASKKVSFKINKEKLQFYSARKQWEAEKGTFEVFVGTNSNAELKKSFVLK